MYSTAPQLGTAPEDHDPALSVCIDGTLDAVYVLDAAIPLLPPLVAQRLVHARDRFLQQAESYLFGGRARTPDTLQQAEAQQKLLALQLHEAASTLDALADALKLHPCGKHEKLVVPAKLAANKAHSQADGWVSR